MQASDDVKERSFTRKGTGFVNVNELPPDSDEEDGNSPHEEASGGKNRHSMKHKPKKPDDWSRSRGTGSGFVPQRESVASDKNHTQRDSMGPTSSRASKGGTYVISQEELPLTDSENEGPVGEKDKPEPENIA